MKKLVSILLTAAVAASSAVMLTSCGDSEYPVEVANYTIEKEPENIVVLDMATADIISYMGYDRKFAARSVEVSQYSLSSAPIVGSQTSPDSDKILQSGADIVFANEKLIDESKTELDNKGIRVIKLQDAHTKDDIRTNYETIGKILGGKKTGLEKGIRSCAQFFDELDKLKREVEGLSEKDTLNTICYLYLKDGKLAEPENDSFANMLLGYTNCVNIAVDANADIDTVSSIASANPNYIFCDDEQTFEAIRSNAALAKLSAVKSNKIYMIAIEKLMCPGQTAIDTLKKMNDFIYGEASAATPDEATKATEAVKTTDAAKATKATEPAATKPTATGNAATQPTTALAATQPATKPAETTTQPATKAAEDVSGKYKIKLDGLSLKKSNDNDNVKAMQQRLSDLGYITDKDNITGYYGDITEQAIRNFQKKNGIKETGTADNKTLKAMFMSSAKKA